MGKQMELEEALAAIPPHQRSIFTPQLEQLDVEPVSIPFGFLGRGERPEGGGWFWAASLDDDRLITVVRMTVRRDFSLNERPELPYCCIGLMCETSLRMMERLWEREVGGSSGGMVSTIHPRTPFLPAEREEVAAFRMEPGSYDYGMAADTVHNGTCLHLLPGYFERLERGYPGMLAGLEERIASRPDCADAIELRSLLRQLGPRHADAPGALLHYRGLADQIVAALAGHLAAVRPAAAGETPSALVDEAKALLADSLEDPPGIDQLAAALHVGRTSLCTRFKRETGMTIGAYLAQVRVHRAEELLAMSDLPLEEVAHRVGYRHQSTFTSAFRQATGATPRSWRLRARRGKGK